ncbi:hypothetical protein CERZMDRAFT_96847 [Cercospora zeae-maydis SCOH1-5]|uniref:Uncharacterized protein n=1 Tax=Cercospora zeae-maydis SCOH1-5 TaxID=717836 RepID=A0A6A6FIC6_9PEZI|nr:hypothetical protein CERZMDRAFT_96847 [Cercospora zeae-maydis SCOH1-5]
MFDATGIVEVFCQRIGSDTPHPEYSPRPLVSDYEDDACTAPNIITQDCFVLHVFLMERFDWMGENVLRMTFSLDDGPAEAIEHIARPRDNDLPPRPKPTDEAKFHDSCFQGHRRLAVASAELQPVNAHGCPLAPQEHDVSQIVLTLQRGRNVVERHAKTHQDREYFVSAAGAAGFPVNVLFNYETTYKGIVHTTKTITYVQSSLPNLELSRSFDPNRKKRGGTESDWNSTAKRQKVLDADDILSTDELQRDDESSYHGPLSPYWSGH